MSRRAPVLTPATVRFCPLCGRELVRRSIPPDGRRQAVCPGCDFVFYLQPKVVAGTLPVQGRRVLLTRRAIEPGRGLWTFPGGFVDWGEDVRAAARRETVEEVALDLLPGPLIGLYSYPGSPVVVAVYLADVPDGAEPVPAPSEVLEVAYFGPAEIPWERLAFPSTRDALRDWVERWSGYTRGESRTGSEA